VGKAGVKKAFHLRPPGCAGSDEEQEQQEKNYHQDQKKDQNIHRR